MGVELDDFFRRVIERTDILSVVSNYVHLTQKNNRYWGCCPFHEEKTASFCVSVDKGFFYCFGCGAGGNAIKFISLIENVPYFDAIKLQGRRLGIELPTKKLSPEEAHKHREEKIFYRINELAQDFFHECLTKTSRGEEGRKYLKERGITPQTIEAFKIGFAPDEWENLLNRFTRQNFSPQQLEAVGLVAKRKNSSGYYDRFRGRIMIPITDTFEHVVGFGGRIIQSTDLSTPKYLNTPETSIFNKRTLLFGLDRSNRAISSVGAAIVVEGYMDAISLFSAGIKNVVATLGVAFTQEHVRLILRYAKKIIFCYDSDEAGQRATIRALPIVQEAGAEVYVVQIPDGKDPDEFIRKHGKEAFKELIKNADTFIDYRIRYVLANNEHTTIAGKLRALQEILPTVVRINNETLRNEYIKKFSTDLVLDEETIRREWKNFSKHANEQNSKEQLLSSNAVKRKKIPRQIDSVIRSAQDVVLRMIWRDNEMLSFVTGLLSHAIFSEQQQEILHWIQTYGQQGKNIDEHQAALELSDEANSELSRVLMEIPDEINDDEIKLFGDSIKILQKYYMRREYHKLLNQAQHCKEVDEINYRNLIMKSLKLKKNMDNL